MHSRWTTKRSRSTASEHAPHAGRLVFLGAWLVVLLTGCHGGAQTDVVEREMRWQEDQIYAMEDYISEYQQLLCQYRAENSALKRQLGSGRQSPRERTQIRRDQQKIQDTQEIIKDVLPTEVPPLMNTMPPPPGASQPPQFGPDLNFRPARRPTRGVRRTALEERVDQPTEETSVSLAAEEPVALDEAFDEAPAAEDIQEAPEETYEGPEPFQNVLVRGDVLPDDGQSGPRLLVDVEPLGASGGPAEFAGELSLMILDTTGDKPQGIARWDFSPDQLAELLGEDPGPTMEFPLQLPADTPTRQPLEIWARLVPAGGEKVLAHAELHLNRPGEFSSVRPQPVVLQEETAQQVAEEEPANKVANEIVESESVALSAGDWNGWQVARPDQLGGKPPGRRASESQWRKATQPIPTRVNRGRPVVASAEATSADSPHVARRTKAADVKPPSWTPNRDDLSTPTSDDVKPPTWSPER